MATEHAIKLADVQDARETIKEEAIYTPVMTSSTMDKLAGRSLHFKCELFQRVGAFKFRGALNAVKKVDSAVSTIITHSSGNHAQAIALACSVTGKKAHIVMPDNSAACKKAAVIGYGATVTDCDIRERVQVANKVEEETPNSCQIPSYNHPHVMAGQGTVALEFLEQVKNLDAIIVPVGGGGLISGITVAAKGIKPSIKIYGAEPAAADDCARSYQAKTLIPLEAPPDTVADGLRTSLGSLTWPIIRDCVDGVFTVNESDIISATRLVWERMKLVIEPSAGVSTAVSIGKEFNVFAEKHGLSNVGVILCGGNTDLDKLPWA
eukprot:m.31454 g.31454  ORF g.31454 m.31454 type:complete len:322 (+) comp8318_c0_seq3:143-1108(+)